MFYCSQTCQRSDWKDHKYHCRKPDAVIRKEAEKPGFGGLKNSVNVPVDIDPVTGEFDARPLMERIRADQQTIGKSKVSAPPAPRTWKYEAPATETEREERMEAFEAVADLSQLSAEEKRTWQVSLSGDDKDLFWAVWQLFAEKDVVLPLHRDNTRCARELVKMLGGQRLSFLARRGHEWMGMEQSDKSRDEEIQSWIVEFAQLELGVNVAESGFDLTLMTRFICARRHAYDSKDD